MATDQTWIYAPAIAARQLNDVEHEDSVELVDRETAEHLAVTALGTKLPDEAMLARMCQEARATGLTWGPHRD